MGNLIGQITISPQSPRPAEPVRVEVTGCENGSTTTARVTINGIVGALQYLQFPTEGVRTLHVVATAEDGSTDEQSVDVPVKGEPLQFTAANGHQDIAMLGVTQCATQPYEAVLTLGSFIDVREPPQLRPPGLRSTGNGSNGKTHFIPGEVGTLTRIFESQSKSVISTESRGLALGRSSLARLNGVTNGNGVARPVKPVRRKTVNAKVFDLGQFDVSKYRDYLPAGTPQPQYEWDFGDGAKETTRSPTIRHDYFSSIDHAGGTGQFLVTCTAVHSGVKVQRTLTIQSAYYLCKTVGTIAPHVVPDLFAHKIYSRLSASFVVHNVEDKEMVLDRLSITARVENPDGLAPYAPFVTLATPVVVAPRSKTLVQLAIPFVTANPAIGEVHYQALGFTAMYAGWVAETPVRCSAVFDIPVAERNKKPRVPKRRDPDLVHKPTIWEEVENSIDHVLAVDDSPIARSAVTLDPRTSTLAIGIGDLGTTPVAVRNAAVNLASTVSAAGLTAFQQETQALPTLELKNQALATAKFAPKMLATTAASPPLIFLIGPPVAGSVNENQICDPDNLDESQLAAADDQQLVCQLTTEVMDVTMPARWGNALKGDIILSPGGDGIIGGLMLNVSPAQWYSHCGIMTRNWDEITHSTGSSKRVMDHLRGIADGSDGFEPQVLKYIWPGAITQSVEASIRGEDFPDPEYAKTYSVSAFGAHTVGVTHNDQMKMIPPLVIQPDPLQETPAIRTALHAIATDARNHAGRPGVKGQYHYRWYCYSDPKIGLNAPEGSGAGWAEGTRPSVCSSYVWMHAKAHGAVLETNQALVLPTDLEQKDIDTGAMVRPLTPDGLYFYTSTERRAAANWLYGDIYNEAYNKAGWLGNILTDAADDVANQFINAFAYDDCDAKDSDNWKNVGDADAISPDDMLWWDGPDKGGLYGFAMPAQYIEPRNESYTVSRWKKVYTRGTIKGRVFADGHTTNGAMVQVYDGKRDYSRGDGNYTLPDVPFGPYNLKAQQVIDGVLKTVQQKIDVNAANMNIDITLQDPPDRYRKALVLVDFWGRDEENFGDDEIHDPGPEYFELELGPDRLINTASRTYKWGGEVRAEFQFTFRLLATNVIDVEINGKLFEGTSEDTDDLDGTGTTTFLIFPDQTAGASLSVTNTDEDDSDEGRIDVTVRNVRNSA